MKKNYSRHFIAAGLFVLALFGLTIAGCDQAEIFGGSLTPVASDFIIEGLQAEYDGSPKRVTVIPDTNGSPGHISIWYEGTDGTNYPRTTQAPTEAGSYAVTFDIAEAGVFNAADGLVAGTLVITNPNLATPVAGHYTITGLGEHEFDNQRKTVSITPIAGIASPGALTVWYTGIAPTNYTRSSTAPSAAGHYSVTFDVAAALATDTSPGFNAAAGLVAGTLSIDSTPENYRNNLPWGSVFSPLTLGLTPGNDTTELYLNWYSAGSPAGKVSDVRFIRGTMTQGREIIEAYGTVAAAGTIGFSHHKVVVRGLRPGASYQYAVSSDGSNWSAPYDFKIPASTGPFRFAMVADAQLNAAATSQQGRVDPLSRYPESDVTTAQMWLETMEKIAAANPGFIASVGDQVDSSNTGNEDEYTHFFAPPGLRSLPYSPISGNHDRHLNYNWHFNWPNPQVFQGEPDNERGRNYFYRYNNILFVVLNSAPYTNSASAAQIYIQRFDETLKAAKAAHPVYDWLIVQHHKSTASVADHAADRDIQYLVEAGFERLMSEHKADLVFAGHDHVYARSYPLSGRDGGLVSVPDTTQGINGIYSSPNDPVYITLSVSSGRGYYAVSSDRTFNYQNTLYVQDNASYPYLGESTAGDGAAFYGSTYYLQGMMPVSNVFYMQPWIPSYTIVDVDGRSLTVKTYTIATVSGTNQGASLPHSFDENVPYDTVTITK